MPDIKDYSRSLLPRSFQSPCRFFALLSHLPTTLNPNRHTRAPSNRAARPLGTCPHHGHLPGVARKSYPHPAHKAAQVARELTAP